MPLEHGPVAFDAVDASSRIGRILARAVVDFDVLEPALAF
jgi:hypothetical protein